MADERPTRRSRTLQLEYQFDRLLHPKLTQAYEVLVPDKLWYTRRSLEVMHGKSGSHYARVSSDQQKERHTIQSQTAALTEYSKAHAYAVPSNGSSKTKAIVGLRCYGRTAERDLAATGQIAAVLTVA